MAGILQKYFPMIRTRREMLEVIFEDERLSDVYLGWSEEQRLEEFLSLVLGQQVKILKVIPNDSARIADESSLVVMDIVVEMEDHSIANVEVQKMGYRFPGQRSACYSADLLLRQYKRVRGERGKGFSYRDIQKVYTVVLYEKSPGEFKISRMIISTIFPRVPTQDLPSTFSRNTALSHLTYFLELCRIKVSETSWKHGFCFSVQMILVRWKCFWSLTRNLGCCTKRSTSCAATWRR